LDSLQGEETNRRENAANTEVFGHAIKRGVFASSKESDTNQEEAHNMKERE
jgi:hypothetical protein